MTENKCSLEEHREIKAIKYCPECKIYMCNKCEKYHSSPIFRNHHPYNLSNEDEIFTGFCKEKNHGNKLLYFCKNHNVLCCATCLCKLNEKGEGQHKDCDVYYLEKIKEEKANKLKENIKCLENLEKNFIESFESLKKINENIEKVKENLKLEIQKVFTKIRNAINNREDELLLEIDNIFQYEYFSENLIKKALKLPKQIKLSLQKGKLIDKEYTNENLVSYINDCINIENNIKNINIINQKINNCNINNKLKIIFSPKDKQLNKFIEKINSFGKLYYFSNNFEKGSQINIKNNLTSININETIVCNYPFQEDKKNYSNSNKLNPYFSFERDNASLTKINNLKCIDTNGLLAVKRDININRDWILYFEYCKKDWAPKDWSHIFSFGKHTNFGGIDDSYYAITLETGPRDGYLIMKLTKEVAGDGNWHKIFVKYNKENKLLEGFVDNKLIDSKVVSLSDVTGFYFGGQGYCTDFSMYLRNFKFCLDLDLEIQDFLTILY